MSSTELAIATRPAWTISLRIANIALLEHGFHVAYCNVADLWGNAEAIRRWDRFYAFLTDKHGLSRRPALEGMSRGGLMIYHWAIAHPQQVSCIYGDAPALGIRPFVKDLDEDDPQLDFLRSWMKAHDLTLPQAKAYTLDALDRLAPLAKAQVPVIHVCGDAPTRAFRSRSTRPSSRAATGSSAARLK